jgi:hypothetical protein
VIYRDDVRERQTDDPEVKRYQILAVKRHEKAAARERVAMGEIVHEPGERSTLFSRTMQSSGDHIGYCRKIEAVFELDPLRARLATKDRLRSLQRASEMCDISMEHNETERGADALFFTQGTEDDLRDVKSGKTLDSEAASPCDISSWREYGPSREVCGFMRSRRITSDFPYDASARFGNE